MGQEKKKETTAAILKWIFRKWIDVIRASDVPAVFLKKKCKKVKLDRFVVPRCLSSPRQTPRRPCTEHHSVTAKKLTVSQWCTAKRRGWTMSCSKKYNVPSTEYFVLYTAFYVPDPSLDPLDHLTHSQSEGELYCIMCTMTSGLCTWSQPGITWLTPKLKVNCTVYCVLYLVYCLLCTAYLIPTRYNLAHRQAKGELHCVLCAV